MSSFCCGCLCRPNRASESTRSVEITYPFLSGTLRAAAICAPRNLSGLRFLCDTKVPEFLLSRDVRVAEEMISTPNGDLALEWVLPARTRARVLPGAAIPEGSQPTVHQFSRIMLYMHGGAFVLCSPGSLRGCTSPVARTLGAAVCVPDYRRPPEHSIQDAVEDGLAVLSHLQRSFPEAEILLGGESAGGGLAAAMLGRLRDGGLQLPAAAMLMSPWTDVGGEGNEAGLRHTQQPAPERDYLPLDMVAWIAHQARGDESGDAFPASPMFLEGALSGLPPIFVIYGEVEVLCGQIEHFCEVWSGKGARIRRCPVPGGVHAPLLFSFCHAQSRCALDELASFFNDPPV